MSKSLGSFTPARQNNNNSTSISSIMPFISQQAMMNRMMQMQDIGMQQAINPQVPGGTVTGVHTPAGVEVGTEEGQKFKAQGDIRTKSLENAKSAALAINILNQSEGAYRKIFGDIIDNGGVHGQLAVAGKYYKGVVKKQDPELTALINDLPNQISFFQRASQETGNIALQKEIRGGKALPILTPNEHPDNLFLPDDPKSALSKFGWLRTQFTNIYNQNMEQYKTGEVTLPQFQTGVQPTPPQQATGQAGTNSNVDPLEGKTAVNPATKQRIIRQGGKWIPMT